MNGESTVTHSLQFGRTKIPFRLEFRPRRRLSISVYPNRSVLVLAPEGRKVDQVLSFVQKRAAWIVKQMDHFQQFHPLPENKRFVSGETHLYLGRQYRLKLIRSKEESVKLIGKYLHVYSDQQKSELTNALLDTWYMARAGKIFSSKLSQCLENSPSLRCTPNKIIVRKMPKRWGSCNKSGNILLNLELVKMPFYCIEYVIMHELCHLRIHDHSPAFYRLLSRCLPDWEKRKARLDSFVL